MLVINEQNNIEVYNIVPVYRGNRIIKFVTSVSMADINNVYDRLIYDVETQRGERLRKKRKEGEVFSEKIVSKINIEEMKSKITNEFFDGGLLCWNVRIPDSSDFDYKSVLEFHPEESKIVIKSNKITMPDSAQRHIAINGLKNFHLSINQETFCFPLEICLYTLVEEQSLFSEINGEGTRASKTRSLFLSSSFKNMLLKDIIKESDLDGNIETTIDNVFRKDKIVAFGTLYASFFDKTRGAFRQLQEEDALEFKKWIIRFYNELIETRPEFQKVSLDERLAYHKTSLATSNPMWHVYAYLARELRGDTNWRRKVARLNATYKLGEYEGDFFSLENPIWKGTILLQTKTGEWKLNNNKRSQDYCLDRVRKFLNLV